MAQYRCQNEDCTEDQHGRLMYDFEADKPVCPKCGMGEPMVMKLETLHFLYPMKEGAVVGRLGKRFAVACNPKKDLKGIRATGEASVCNCKACKETEAWKAAYQPPEVRLDLVEQPKGG